jgi:predicted DNA-binding protein YlxM (UPF0122 family)
VNRPLSEKTRKRIKQFYEQGLRQTEIARATRISQSSVHQYLKAQGFLIPKQKPRLSVYAQLLRRLFPDGLPADVPDSLIAYATVRALRDMARSPFSGQCGSTMSELNVRLENAAATLRAPSWVH